MLQGNDVWRYAQQVCSSPDVPHPFAHVLVLVLHGQKGQYQIVTLQPDCKLMLDAITTGRCKLTKAASTQV